MSGASIDRIGGGGPLGGIGKTRSWDRRPIILGPNEISNVEKEMRTDSRATTRFLATLALARCL